jgi:hypothetical protein
VAAWVVNTLGARLPTLEMELKRRYH